MGTLHEDLCTFMIISCWIILRIRNVSDKSFRQNQNTRFMFNNFFRKSSYLWDNVENIVELEKPQITVWCTCISHWYLRLQTHTFKVCNTYFFSTATKVAQTCFNVMLHINCLTYCSFSSACRFLETPFLKVLEK